MKKLMTLLAAFAITLTLAGCFGGEEASNGSASSDTAKTTASNKYTAGKDYTVLNTQKSESPLVTEYFSFYCPHCNAFEPTVYELKQHIGSKADFKKVPVLFMGGPMAKPMAKGYAVMVELGVENKLVPLMFNRIHNQRRAPQTEAELRNFFVSNGVSVVDYNKAYNSFAITSAVQAYDKSFKDAGLNGVPAIVVNNKYLVDLAKFQNPDNAFELIDYLLTI